MTMTETVTARLRDGDVDWRTAITLTIVGLCFAVLVAGLVAPDSLAGTLVEVTFAKGTLASALRLSVPIALASLGGIFSEKSGIINIGLEGLLIISAFTAVFGTWATGSLWVGYLGGILASTLLAGLFAVVCIEFRADQIIAGLAVWLIALGLAPFGAQLVFGGPNTSSVKTPPTLTELVAGIPGVSDALVALASLPFVGALFDAGISVYLLFLMVGVAWYLLEHTQFGRWVRAAGENPEALATAGVDVSRVRYAAVLCSGVLCGMGGAALSLGLGQFTGNGPTMVNGKGFIAIVAYLFGNYHPVGAFLSTLLFAGLDALQNALQVQNVGLPTPLVRIVPFVMVIVVLTLFGRTRIPAAAGEHFDAGEK
jgi:simple sugar transport system permease protein